ncbi:MAG: hypothetical protein HAW62_05480 [Endozoicomonadaceae bacterium]|nr:hypothetical protein [Endozoicomonadaceae bacterium]
MMTFLSWCFPNFKVISLFHPDLIKGIFSLKTDQYLERPSLFSQEALGENSLLSLGSLDPRRKAERSELKTVLGNSELRKALPSMIYFIDQYLDEILTQKIIDGNDLIIYANRIQKKILFFILTGHSMSDINIDKIEHLFSKLENLCHKVNVNPLYLFEKSIFQSSFFYKNFSYLISENLSLNSEKIILLSSLISVEFS